MWDDEPAPWDIEETPEEQPAEGEAAAEGGAAAAPAELPKVKLEKIEPPHYNHHWVRPLFLNYAYLYEYRKNYYDDVIDYLNQRQRGIFREPPRAQEWAERVMRTYDEKNTDKSYKRSADMKEIINMRHDPRYYSYHTRAYYSLKYQKIL
ncbi:flightin [Megachile rotundata]|uniref:flightin n=1 Tax=Megachile rotundata TaxID=143995 RepID=UPI000258EEB8|nr:PREDICTED: flightin [Megachile rotundata]XP_012147769.1 PREDICTED: flightin [Megachile rotundata]XP_012147770.1 PREDICTED: flightin [Megachile rotundata]XP_012147771.1 PREDICTED: flightin [Megachile rotundata]XP_012147772.1 PREDICTED: flightin [Megachile rotundata]XP_012147773.1 PREDICTED: flightin [Megachile rotundata]